jgi:hypothetical protein
VGRPKRIGRERFFADRAGVEMSAPAPNRPTPISSVPPEVYAAPAPIVSVYMNTRGALPDAAEQVALRWRNIRRSLIDQGAPESALEAVETMLDGAHAAGETLVVIANASGVLYSAHLPELPADDIALVAPLPHMLPLIAATQRMLPHVVVAIDRVGAEIIAVLPDRPDAQRQVEGADHHVTRSAPGGWSQRRFQQRAENRWEAHARNVAEEISTLVDDTTPRLVVVSGDVRAVAFLRDHLPARVTDILHEVQGDYSSVDEALLRSQDLVSAVADRETAEVVADWEQTTGRATLPTTGPEAVLEALRDGRAAMIIIDPSRAVGETGWFGSEPSQVGATAGELVALGVEEPVAAPLVDVLVRAAVATDARVWVAQAPQLGPVGVGVTLRY